MSIQDRLTHRMIDEPCYIPFISGIYYHFFTYLKQLPIQE